MVLLGDVGRVEARFGTFADNVSLGTRELHGWRRTLHRLGSSFGCTRCIGLEIVLDAPDGSLR